MKDIVIWILIWFGAWAIFNIKVRWFLEKYQSRSKFIGRGLFFIIIFLIIYGYFNQYLVKYGFMLITATIIANVLGIIFSLDRDFYKKFVKDRFFLLFQTFNILFQQSLIIVGISILKNLFGDSYKDYYFGIWFFLFHLPILILPWTKIRLISLSLTFAGGYMFSYLINNISYGVIISFFFTILSMFAILVILKMRKKFKYENISYYSSF